MIYSLLSEVLVLLLWLEYRVVVMIVYCRLNKMCLICMCNRYKEQEHYMGLLGLASIRSWRFDFFLDVNMHSWTVIQKAMDAGRLQIHSCAL